MIGAEQTPLQQHPSSCSDSASKLSHDRSTAAIIALKLRSRLRLRLHLQLSRVYPQSGLSCARNLKAYRQTTLCLRFSLQLRHQLSFSVVMVQNDVTPPRLTWFVSLGSKLGCEPQMRHQNKGIFSQNVNLEWLLLAFEATRFDGALKSAAPNDL